MANTDRPITATPKAWAQLIKSAQKQGFMVIRRRAGHLKLTAPNGEIYFASCTMSDPRAIKNNRAWMIKNGYQL